MEELTLLAAHMFMKGNTNRCGTSRELKHWDQNIYTHLGFPYQMTDKLRTVIIGPGHMTSVEREPNAGKSGGGILQDVGGIPE
jgi:hypothetical protein